MKRLALLILVLAAALSRCTWTPSQEVAVGLSFGMAPARGPRSASGPSRATSRGRFNPATVSAMGCFFINATGPGIVPSLGTASLAGVSHSCLGLGSVSDTASLTTLSTTGTTLRLAAGPGRTLQVIGVVPLHGGSCAGKQVQDLYTSEGAPTLYDVGHTTTDLFRDSVVTVTNGYDSAATPFSAKCGGGSSSGGGSGSGSTLPTHVKILVASNSGATGALEQYTQSSDGSLSGTPAASTDAPILPKDMTISPQNDAVFVSGSGTFHIYPYSVDSNAQVTLGAPGVAFGASGTMGVLYISPLSQLFLGVPTGPKISVIDVGSSATLGNTQNQSVVNVPNSLATNASGNQLYSCVGSAILDTYTIAPGGNLTPITPIVGFPIGYDCLHIRTNPAGNRLYMSADSSTQLLSFPISPTTGITNFDSSTDLSQLPISASAPITFDISPDGKHLYAADGANKLVHIPLNSDGTFGTADTATTTLPGAAVTHQPNLGVAVDPFTGKFVYVLRSAGLGSFLAGYALDTATGVLGAQVASANLTSGLSPRTVGILGR